MISTDRLHTFSQNSEIVVERLRHLPIGGRMKDLPPHLWHESYVRVGAKKTGGPNLRLLRLDPQLPSNTITAYIFNKFAHPFEHRYITPREAARLQQFPDEHEFAGPITKVQLQIGNAVPVGLARAVAGHVANRLQKTETRPLTAVGLFAGAGAMDIGFQDYFNVKATNEIIPEFCETLELNMTETDIVRGDISDLSGLDMYSSSPDVVFGGPPCQPFSAAGKHGGVMDPRGKLAAEFLRMVSELSPKYFVLENVPGLRSNKNGGALKFILELSEQLGYKAEHFVLNAADYGVPQLRNRLFVIGRRDPLSSPLGPPNPTHALTSSIQPGLFLKPYMTVGSALAGLGPARSRLQETRQVNAMA